MRSRRWEAIRHPTGNGIHLAQTMSFDKLDRCLDLITYNGAKMLNVEEEYGIEAGKPAHFLVLDAATPFEAVRRRAGLDPPRRAPLQSSIPKTRGPFSRNRSTSSQSNTPAARSADHRARLSTRW